MHIFSVRLEREEPAISLLVAQFSGEHSIEWLLEQIYNGYSTERLEADAIVIRPDVRDIFSPADLHAATTGETSSDSAFLRQIAVAYENSADNFARFSTLPIFVLHSDGIEPRLSSNINILASTPPLISHHLGRSDVLEVIRSAEMRYLIDVSRALLPPVENTFYKNPSGRAARSFLRVGNIQYSRLAVDAVTFWLVPFLHGCEAILVDTWSLSSVALNVSRVLADIRGKRPIPVEMLSQYQDQSMERQAALTEILDRLVSDANAESKESLKVGCIVSVTHTGSLVSALRQQVELSDLEINLDFVALYQLAESGQLKALCDLSNDPDFAPLRDEEVGLRPSIAIDERTYFPLTFVDFTHTVLKPQADPFRQFLEMVHGKEIISVHRDHHDDGPRRHHAIHIDTAKLIELPEFKRKFQIALGALLPPPSIILTPKHAAAKQLSDLACDLIEELNGWRPKVISHANLHLDTTGRLSSEDGMIKENLLSVDPSSSILTLDDCFISGARMTGYQGRLRQHNVQARLHYLVVLARPENPRIWTDFKRKLTFRAPEDRTLHQQNTISAIFEIAIPNWHQSKCPWCQEKLLYDKLDSDGDLAPQLQLRRRELANQDTGLLHNLFLDPSDNSIKLYPGSIFAPADSSQAEVFAAVSAAIHQLRITPAVDKPLLGVRRHPIATVLQATDYLHDMYTDTIIRASFLRGAQREELIYTNEQSEAARTNLISELMVKREDDVSNLALELILASALLKCTISKEVDNPDWNDLVVEFLKLARMLNS